MSDPTLSALVLIGLVFGGVAAASGLLRAALILSGLIRELTKSGRQSAPWPSLAQSNPA
jgi:hypothetical protein